MPKVQESIEIKASPAACYKVIWDFAKYPDFVDAVKAISVRKKKEKTCEVDFTLDLIKTVTYTIKAHGEPGDFVEWDLVAGQLFKKNWGRWDLEELKKGLTLATYTLDVEFSLFVPGPIAKMLVV